MSHIPASKMPHAKPHDDHAQDHEETAAAPVTPGPEVKPANGGKDAPPKPDRKPTGGGSTVPYVAIAAVGALAIGGIVAALALRHPDAPAPKEPKGKNKGRGRKRDAD